MIRYVWFCGAPDSEERCTKEEPYHLPSPRAKRRVNTYFCGEVAAAWRCNADGCTNELDIHYSGHVNYEQMKLSSYEGWFFRKDESETWCFDHLPVSIVAWRDRSNPGWRDKLRKGLAEKLPSIETAERVARAGRVRYTGSSR